MSVTDEKDKLSYALSGNTNGIKPGNRMALKGKKIGTKDAAQTLVWQTEQINKDFGLCQP